jgi:hypothetical protein
MEREIRRAIIIGMTIGFILGVVWTSLFILVGI